MESAAGKLGWVGAGLTVAGAAWETYSDATTPAMQAQGPTHFYHEMAGSMFGTTGGLLGGVAGEIFAGELIAGAGLVGGTALAATIGVPLLIGFAAGAALHGFFNWALPELKASSVTTSPSGNVGGILFDKCAVFRVRCRRSAARIGIRAAERWC